MELGARAQPAPRRDPGAPRDHAEVAPGKGQRYLQTFFQVRGGGAPLNSANARALQKRRAWAGLGGTDPGIFPLGFWEMR